MSLKEFLIEPEKHREDITDFFRCEIIPKAIEQINASFAPQRLSKQSREIEPLPTDQRQLSSYRTRLGTMLEYGLSTEMETILKNTFGKEIFLTFAVAHEFPDFYLRDKNRIPLLKIEMKAVDADSDEQAARFDVLIEHLDQHRDFILFIGWKWETQITDGISWESPQIFTFAFVSAYDLGVVRDARLIATGGKIENGEVLVPSTKNPGTFTKDPGNYGKLWRIIQRKQRTESSELSFHALDFLRFLNDVNTHAPRKRMDKNSTDTE
ncbi:MAG: hypothetical protein M0Q21_00765 [Ignavibacteriaceae bacterium]|nr:hypothetical protein [Ignavibacteriaceae bacterium]